MSKLTDKAETIQAFSNWKKAIPHQTTLYIIAPYSLVEPFLDQILPYVYETDETTLRHTTSGDDKVILKWKPLLYPIDFVYPSLKNRIDTIMSQIDLFTYDEILVELQNEEWQGDVII